MQLIIGIPIKASTSQHHIYEESFFVDIHKLEIDFKGQSFTLTCQKILGNLLEKNNIINFSVYLVMSVVAGNACARPSFAGVTTAVAQGQQTVRDAQSFISHPTISGGAKTFSDVRSFASTTADMF